MKPYPTTGFPKPPVEEIGNDPDKVEIMHEFHSALKNSQALIPEGVLQLYEKVYLRDVWDGTNEENP